MLALYLIFAAVSLWIARAFGKLSPRAAVTLTLLPLAFTGSALLTGRVYAPLDLHYRAEPLQDLQQQYGLNGDWSRTRHDMAFEQIPWRKAVRFAISRGEWPLWNPFVLSGDVLAASAQPAAYHPISAAGYLLPLGPSLTFVATAIFFTAGLAMFVFCRDLGCGEGAASIGAAGWMFCGMMVFWIGWPLTIILAVFPALLHAIRLIVRSPGLGSTVYLTSVFVLILLGGHPETAFQSIAAGLAFGLLELATAFRERRAAALPYDGLFKSAGLAVLAGFVALSLTAIELLPLLEATPQTFLYSRRSADAAPVSVSWGTALERLRLIVAPYAYGLPWREPTRAADFGAYWYAYVGSVLLGPAIFGLWRSPERRRWWLLAAACAGMLLFVAAPGLIDLLELLPMFEITINRRMVFVTGFAVSALAALGIEAWTREHRSRRLGWLQAGAVAGLAIAVALLWPGFREEGLSAELLGERTLLELLPAALAAVLLLTVRSVRLCTFGLLALLAGQRVMQSGELNPSLPAELLAPPVEKLDLLPDRAEPYRIVGVGDVLQPNMAALYELEDVRGTTPMAHGRLVKTFPLWADKSSIRPNLPEVQRLDRPFLSFLNVRFALVDRSQAAAIPANGAAGWIPRPQTRRGRYIIYQNTRALPRAFVPGEVRMVSPEEKVYKLMRREKDFSRRAWIEVSGPQEAASREYVPNGPGRVRTKRRGLGLDLKVAMEKPGWVVVSQTAWKGWRAFEGDRELPLSYANHAFLAFHVPAGGHRVELVYRPRSFIWGRAITLATAGVAVCFLCGVALRRIPYLPPRRKVRRGYAHAVRRLNGTPQAPV